MSSVPVARFRAHSTPNGEALARDGQPYLAIDRQPQASRPSDERSLSEIEFGTGRPTLSRLYDLIQVVPRASL